MADWTRFDRAGLAATALLLALGSGCGEDAQADSSCDTDCVAPPPPLCDGTTAVTFGALGECVGGQCVYPQTRSTCEDGCDAGTCVTAEPCDPADCVSPPADRCDGDTVLRYDAGTCVADECVYPATAENCAATGDRCVDAECVPGETELCDGVTCDEPPAPRCDGDTLVTAAAPGTCDPADGACDYTEERVDCAATGGTCARGACQQPDPCTAVDCSVPPPIACDGNVPLSYQGPGTCIEDAGQPGGYRCVFSETRGEPCSDGCSEGICVDPECTIECRLPPPDTCTTDNVARRYPDVGVCVDGGRCSYAPTEEDCAATGQRCDPTTVTCVDDPCSGVDCSTAPAPTCDGNVVVTSTAPGSCTAGACSFPVTLRDCGALFCLDGECVSVDPCAGVECTDPAPAPRCEGNVAVTSFDPSYCVRGACAWDEERVDCAEGGGVCADGACVFDGRCDGGCDAPPDDVCIGTIARQFPAVGECSVSDTCIYAPTDTDCRSLGLGCVDGACVDVCATTTCNTPPAPRCDGGAALTYAATGTCAEGVCSYAVTRTRCADLGLTCDAGACVAFDYCPTIICETPPDDVCDGNTAVQYATDGTCNETTDSCEYDDTRINCAASGQFCLRGACQATDPCTGIACDVAPAASCSADTAIRPTAPGVCEFGLCSFDSTEYWCGLESAACLRGECVGGELCDALDCAAEEGPEPRCDRDVRITYTPRCRVGLCLWDIVRTDCRDAGDWCYEGECVDFDPCTLVTCDDPPADICEGDLLYRYEAVGDCAYTECSYDAEVIDCAASDSFCAAGACRPNDNPCRDVVCDEPGVVCADNDVVAQRLPGVCELGVCLYADGDRTDCDTAPAPRCDGRVATTWADDVACFDGECVFTETRTDCSASGRYCDEGACVLDDPCQGVVCGGGPTTACEGDRVVSRAAAVCDSGLCRADVVDVVDCTVTGQVCEAGACAPDDDCDGIVCDDPPPAYCVDTYRFSYIGDGLCSRGECDYAPVRFDCRGAGQVCVDGECVPPAPCEGVDCSGPAPAPVCDGDVAVTYFGTGDCAQGACVYLSTRTDCGNVRGGYCEGGACANVCDGVVCDDPPAAECLGNQVAEYVTAGECDAELGCTYAIAEVTDCGASDLVCVDGACVDPCAGVVCDDPPPPTCAGNGIAEYEAVGECSAGACLYDLLDPVGCGDDVCVDGVCVPYDPCDVLECPAGPRCVGNQVFTSARAPAFATASVPSVSIPPSCRRPTAPRAARSASSASASLHATTWHAPRAPRSASGSSPSRPLPTGSARSRGRCPRASSPSTRPSPTAARPPTLSVSLARAWMSVRPWSAQTTARTASATSSGTARAPAPARSSMVSPFAPTGPARRSGTAPTTGSGASLAAASTTPSTASPRSGRTSTDGSRAIRCSRSRPPWCPSTTSRSSSSLPLDPAPSSAVRSPHRRDRSSLRAPRPPC